ncbi:MAG: hypothetical protein PVG39_25870 [Desulfobacteraceae bacterium]|jgi:hypothetical protein
MKDDNNPVSIMLTMIAWWMAELMLRNDYRNILSALTIVAVVVAVVSILVIG